MGLLMEEAPQPRRQRRGGLAGGLGRRRSPACGVLAFGLVASSRLHRCHACHAGGNYLPAPSGFSPALDWLSHCWIRAGHFLDAGLAMVTVLAGIGVCRRTLIIGGQVFWPRMAQRTRPMS